MYMKNYNHYNQKFIKSYTMLFQNQNYKSNFLLFIVTIIAYSLFDNYFFNMNQYRWFEKIKNLLLVYFSMLVIVLFSLLTMDPFYVKSTLIILISFTTCLIMSSLIVFSKKQVFIEPLSTVASSDQNTYDWKPFEQPDMPPMTLINDIKNKYNKDFTNFRNNFLVTNAECLYYNKFGKFPYNNNLLRPSYDHMKALDPQNKQSFEDWRDSYYKSAQENVPMRVLILKSTSGSVGYELQGIKETDFANKLYQGKLKLDEITLVGCRSNGKPYMKENGIMDTTKSDASIYEAINNVYDIEFLESNNDGCTKNRQLCTQNNILACPFRFKSDDGNTRMSDVMAKYWNMDDKQLKPFNTGCYSNESCKKQENA